MKVTVLIVICILLLGKQGESSESGPSALLLRILQAVDENDEPGSRSPTSVSSGSRSRRFTDTDCSASLGDYGTTNNGENSETPMKDMCGWGNRYWRYWIRKRSLRDKRLGWGNRAILPGRKRSRSTLRRLLDITGIAWT